MKTNEERINAVKEKLHEKRQNRKRKRIAYASLALAFLTAINLVLFIPYPTVEAVDVAQKYQQSEYCSLITKLDKVTYRPQRLNPYKNNFDKWIGSKFRGMFRAKLDMDSTYGGAVNELAKGENGYVETTDNQTAGVIEGDLLKRTQSHIFYLEQTGTGCFVRVYDINGLDSKEVARYEISPKDGITFYADTAELYLSQDGDRATVVLQGYQKQEGNWSQPYVVFVGLDVSNATAVRETDRKYLSGVSVSTRKKEDVFLAVAEFSVRYNPNFDNQAEFLPQYGAYGQMESVMAEDIILPDTLTNARYVCAYTIDEKTLQPRSSIACLSYAQDIYVAEENMYFLHGYSDKEEREDGKYASLDKTEISRISYTDGELNYEGAFSVDGSVKNRYALDEYDGVLRVVTNCRESVYQTLKSGENTSRKYLYGATRVNLYCVNVADYSLLASVEDFAPKDERAESVRFDKDKAYVCTAIVVTLTDPVFVFDLSDLTNITYKDTGEIDGYSTSLISFGNGFSVGIGYDWERYLKIEVYEERENGVVSVDAYVASVEFSEDYKSYFIDRENGYIGLGVYDASEDGQYLLLSFDGYKLHLEKKLFLIGDNAKKRGVVIDGYLYAFGEGETGFAVGAL